MPGGKGEHGLIQANPDDEINYFKIAVALNELGRSGEAAEYLRDAIEKHGIRSAGLYYDRAWSCIRRSKEEGADGREQWITWGLEALRHAIELEGHYLDRAKADQDFDSVRDRIDFPGRG